MRVFLTGGRDESEGFLSTYLGGEEASMRELVTDVAELGHTSRPLREGLGQTLATSA